MYANQNRFFCQFVSVIFFWQLTVLFSLPYRRMRALIAIRFHRNRRRARAGTTMRLFGYYYR